MKQGEKVEAGQDVGAVGCTGSCFGDHLHFEVHEGQDPYGAVVRTRCRCSRSCPQAKD